MEKKLEKHILSKSTFMYGYQCPKRLWLHKFKPELRDEVDEEQQAIFQTGTDIGVLAQQRFPGGVDARPVDSFHYQQSVLDTAAYIQQGKTIIYEAAFQFNGVLVALDILVKKRGKWYAYEVKSTNSVKSHFILDTALQYYVISNAGIQIEDFYILHLNREYIRKGALDVQQLFMPTSVLKEVIDYQDEVVVKVNELKKICAGKVMPAIAIGDHCDKPYPCDFQGFCWKEVALEAPDYGKPFINKPAIRDFISQLEYPLYFIDFESWRTAIPEYDGHWPFRQVCFQYSVHLQKSAGASVEHYEYLAANKASASREFLENLLKVCGKKGSVVVYNIAFEKTRLRELVIEHTDYEKQVSRLIDRLVDLMKPFRKDYRLPAMEGSYSIKYVLPALIPELSYADMPISNGGMASEAFYRLIHETDQEIISATRKALLEYCKLDTWAMVKIFEKIKDI